MALLGGFQFQEKMSGSYTLSGGTPARRMSFSARVRAADAVQHLRDGMAELEGTVELEGFADEVPMSGTIQISPLRKRLIRYEFSFVANDGRPYRFAGQKDIRFGDLLGSWTTLPATIYDRDGREVGQARVTFDMRSDFVPLLVSF